MKIEEFNKEMNENLKDYEIGVEISLTNIAIAEELKIPNYRYELLQDTNKCNERC